MREVYHAIIFRQHYIFHLSCLYSTLATLWKYSTFWLWSSIQNTIAIATYVYPINTIANAVWKLQHYGIEMCIVRYHKTKQNLIANYICWHTVGHKAVVTLITVVSFLHLRCINLYHEYEQWIINIWELLLGKYLTSLSNEFLERKGITKTPWVCLHKSVVHLYR